MPHRDRYGNRQDSIRKVALYASVEVQPLAAYFGGVVAQEVVKVTGKYTPLDQWLHLDFLEVGTLQNTCFLKKYAAERFGFLVFDAVILC